MSEAHNGFAIIGYGKLGGLEMSYSSDLDLVFIHDIDEEAMTLGEKPISGMKFAARLAQNWWIIWPPKRAMVVSMRLICACAPRSNGYDGGIYPYVWTLPNAQSLGVGEHQALVRTMPFAGITGWWRDLTKFVKKYCVCRVSVSKK